MRRVLAISILVILLTGAASVRGSRVHAQAAPITPTSSRFILGQIFCTMGGGTFTAGVNGYQCLGPTSSRVGSSLDRVVCVNIYHGRYNAESWGNVKSFTCSVGNSSP